MYTDNGEVVIADNEMVLVHCKDIETTNLHLHHGDVTVENGKCNTALFNSYTGERIL